MTDPAAESADDARSADDAEVLDLFSRLGDDLSARDLLVERFQSLAAYLARRFAGRGEALEDLTQVANIGLLAAIDRFDPSREVRFATYAAATIVGELKRHLRDKAWAVRVPRKLQELGIHINQALPALTQQLGRSPTIREIADRLDASPEEILEAMDAARAFSAASIDEPIRDTGTTVSETLSDPDDSMELMEQWATVAPAVRGLPERERRVLFLRFFKGLTQTEIAREIGVSQMHVSRILSHTLATLRETADADSV
jgi:RNA polymerase sigma-B factor